MQSNVGALVMMTVGVALYGVTAYWIGHFLGWKRGYREGVHDGLHPMGVRRPRGENRGGA